MAAPLSTVPFDQFAMTFEEIGRAEGITKGGAYMACRSGLRKLRRKGVQMQHLRALAAELDRGRHHTEED